MTAPNSLARLTRTTLSVTSALECLYLRSKAEICIKEKKINSAKLTLIDRMNDQGQREISAHLIIQFGLFMNNCVGSTMNRPTGTMFSRINT